MRLPAGKGIRPAAIVSKGILRFKALPELPSAIELQIAGVGGVATRAFR